ncbi:hypothetical protein U9M48_030224 [Paspalum notatum var. saurae]|uniref:Uncharacterized protein n=1 Tax=Paspalum notatum var. saurae TaxID=547442 RepID=A0AAQ3TZP4_PASNO
MVTGGELHRGRLLYGISSNKESAGWESEQRRRRRCGSACVGRPAGLAWKVGRTGPSWADLSSESEHQEDDPKDPEYLPEENTDDQDSGDNEPDNIVTREDWYED